MARLTGQVVKQKMLLSFLLKGLPQADRPDFVCLRRNGSFVVRLLLPDLNRMGRFAPSNK